MFSHALEESLTLIESQETTPISPPSSRFQQVEIMKILIYGNNHLMMLRVSIRTAFLYLLTSFYEKT